MSDIFNHEADAWDSLIDGLDYEEWCRGPRANFGRQLPTCNKCGKRFLNWKKIGGRYVLHDGATQHTCNESTNYVALLAKMKE